MLKEPRLVSEADLAVLRVNAITDPLTGLYNRRFLLDHLGREISRAERSESIVSVVLMDLKGFKSINDRLGAIRWANSVLVRHRARHPGVAARGGCRVPLGRRRVRARAAEHGHVLRARRRRARPREDRRDRVTARGGLALDLHYGVASYPHDGKSTDFLLKIADLRLYQCRSQSTFAATAHRMYPRFAPRR